MTPWEIVGLEMDNCNCAYGCPCQFNALPTQGSCEFVGFVQIEKGHYGAVKLDGLRCASITKWPGPIHLGNGTQQHYIDERADPKQRDALEKIMNGKDTEDMATMWWVFAAMSPNKLKTLFVPIEMDLDIEKRSGKLRIPGVVETKVEPIKNPVTGADHRARINLPHGFEYRFAEVASGTSKTSGELELKNNNNSHVHMARLHLSHKGVVEQKAA